MPPVDEFPSRVVVHAFGGQGDFSLTRFAAALRGWTALRCAADQVFGEIDVVADRLGVRPFQARLLGAAPAVTAAGLAAETPGTAQLALYGTCLAVHRALAADGLAADRVLGVSFGEIPALVAAGACDLAAGGLLAYHLGRLLMRRPGGMLLLAVGERGAERLLTAAAADSAAVACVNDDGETVVAGPGADLERVEAAARAAGVEAHRLRLPFLAHHPALAAERIEFAALAGSLPMVRPEVPVISAVAGRVYGSAGELPAGLGACLTDPVRLPDVVRLTAAGAADGPLVLEAGPGAALTRNIRNLLTSGRAVAPIAGGRPRFGAGDGPDSDVPEMTLRRKVGRP